MAKRTKDLIKIARHIGFRCRGINHQTWRAVIFDHSPFSGQNRGDMGGRWQRQNDGVTRCKKLFLAGNNFCTSTCGFDLSLVRQIKSNHGKTFAQQSTHHAKPHIAQANHTNSAVHTGIRIRHDRCLSVRSDARVRSGGNTYFIPLVTLKNPITFFDLPTNFPVELHHIQDQLPEHVVAETATDML